MEKTESNLAKNNYKPIFVYDEMSSSKYHPHGDQAIYDALVRLTQNFSMSLPLNRRPR